MRDPGTASQQLSTIAEHGGRQMVDQAAGVLILALRLPPGAAAQLLNRGGPPAPVAGGTAWCSGGRRCQR